MESWLHGINILHISDTHIPDKRGNIHEGVNPCKKLDKLLDLAQRLDLNPSFSVITGDISNTGTEKSYNLAKKYIAQLQDLGGPVFLTMGTKDNRTNFRKILLETVSLREEPYCYYSESIEGLHLIAMDSHTVGSHIGSFNIRQLDWLEKELEENDDKPAIIAFHEPIFFFGEAGLFNKRDAIRFKNIISKGNVLAVLNGHLHRSFYTVIDGIQYIQAGSPLWENSIKDSYHLSYDSSSFNLLSYSMGNLSIRPVSFSDRTSIFRKIDDKQMNYRI